MQGPLYRHAFLTPVTFLTFCYGVKSSLGRVPVLTWALVDLGWGHDIAHELLAGDFLPVPHLVVGAVQLVGGEDADAVAGEGVLSAAAAAAAAFAAH
jgi:hypothetical protein